VSPDIDPAQPAYEQPLYAELDRRELRSHRSAMSSLQTPQAAVPDDSPSSR
jgi:hypothetical protein